MEEILRYVGEAGARLGRGLRRGMEGRKRFLVEAVSGLRRVGRDLTRLRRRDLKDREESLLRGLEDLIRDRRHALRRLAGTMDALSPLSTLQRGYAVPLDSEGRVLRTTVEFTPGGLFELRVVDGRVECETLEVRKDEDRSA
jgi:exodeoxyribonuclease VII large subunit